MVDEKSDPHGDHDGWADAAAATAVITLAVAAVVYWLSTFPA